MPLETPTIYNLCTLGLWVCIFLFGVVVMGIAAGQSIMPGIPKSTPVNHLAAVDEPRQTLDALRLAHQVWKAQLNTTERIRSMLIEAEKDLGTATLAKVRAREAHLEAVNVSFS